MNTNPNDPVLRLAAEAAAIRARLDEAEQQGDNRAVDALVDQASALEAGLLRAVPTTDAGRVLQLVLALIRFRSTWLGNDGQIENMVDAVRAAETLARTVGNGFPWLLRFPEISDHRAVLSPYLLRGME